MLSTKTQFAGKDVHKILIYLFRYISKKYFSEFELIDEGRFWETGDEKILNNQFNLYNGILDSFRYAVNNISRNANESIEDYFERIIKIVSEKIKK